MASVSSTTVRADLARRLLSPLPTLNLPYNMSDKMGDASCTFSRVDLGDTVNMPDNSGQITPTDVRAIQSQTRPLQSQSPYLV